MKIRQNVHWITIETTRRLNKRFHIFSSFDIIIVIKEIRFVPQPVRRDISALISRFLQPCHDLCFIW